MSVEDLNVPAHQVGGMNAYRWDADPKLVGVVLARYKFAAKLLEGKERVLEVGCADGFGSRVVRQHVGHLTAVDIDPVSIREARLNMSEKWPIDFWCCDFTRMHAHFDGAYALDVLEHIEHGKDESNFLYAMSRMAPVAVIGMPSLQSQAYASSASRQGHVNCLGGHELKERLRLYWKNVFVFTMNDEQFGMSFYPMANYLLALAVA